MTVFSTRCGFLLLSRSDGDEEEGENRLEEGKRLSSLSFLPLSTLASVIIIPEYICAWKKCVAVATGAVVCLPTLA